MRAALTWAAALIFEGQVDEEPASRSLHLDRRPGHGRPYSGLATWG